MSQPQTAFVIDALQASNWNRKIFETWNSARVIAVHVTLSFWHDCMQTLNAIGKWNQLFAENSDLIVRVEQPADIDAARASGRTGVILGFQNSSSLEDDLMLVEIFHRLGIRIMQLTYNNQNSIGAGCYEAADAGLTRFGRNVIREMNRLGMIIDVSHTAERTALEAMEYSTRPIAITHANPSSFHDVKRNKSDTVLRQLSAQGGMLGFSVYPLHLAGGSNCTLTAFCQMIAKTADLMGVESLGLGTDLCQGHAADYLRYMRDGKWKLPADTSDSIRWPAYPAWFQDSRDFELIAGGLGDAGFSAPEIDAIFSGNWYRFFASSMPAQAPDPSRD